MRLGAINCVEMCKIDWNINEYRIALNAIERNSDAILDHQLGLTFAKEELTVLKVLLEELI